MNINKYLEEHKTFFVVGGVSRKFHAPEITCQDGFALSVQASAGHYCEPRIENAEHYSRVEVYTHQEEPDLLMFSTVTKKSNTGCFACVPVEVVEEIIKKHGGIKC